MHATGLTIVTRRTLFRVASRLCVSVAAVSLTAARSLSAPSDEPLDADELVRRITGVSAIESPRVHLTIPAVWGNGYGVPLTLAVESPMIESDYVRQITVLAPLNPIIPVANFQFTPHCGRAAVTTRIRLAKSQDVFAVAEMSGGAFLMTRTGVQVESDGCR